MYVSSIVVLKHVEDKVHLVLLKGFKWGFASCAYFPKGNFYTLTSSIIKAYSKPLSKIGRLHARFRRNKEVLTKALPHFKITCSVDFQEKKIN